MKKTVLITGASSGIGYELARLFAQDNYTLLLTSNNQERLNKSIRKLNIEYPQTIIHGYSADISSQNSPMHIYGFAKQHVNRVDVLVNNAGVQVYGNFHETSLSDNLWLMQINMNALVMLTHLFVKDMIFHGSGKILNIGSTGSFSSCPLNAVYCASKAFVLSFSEAIAEELKSKGISVTTLCPGPTQTNFAKKANIEDIALFRGSVMSAQRVAKIGYRALINNRRLVISGLRNKMQIVAVRFTPRIIVVKIGKHLMRLK